MTPHAMTPHLTPEELIDSRERQLPPARQAHADACAVCRAELAQLNELLLNVAAVDVPEPSPLFWDHLSARIRDRVAHEPPPASVRDNPLSRLTDWLTGWGSAPRWAFAAALLALCASLGFLAWSEWGRDAGRLGTPGLTNVQGRNSDDVPSGASPSSSASASASTSASSSPSSAVEGALAGMPVPLFDMEPEWTLMVQMAEDVSWDDAEAEGEAEGSSLYVRPAAVERALIELTAEERDRLLQIVQADLARQKSS
jgi:hypothetical protein